MLIIHAYQKNLVVRDSLSSVSGALALSDYVRSLVGEVAAINMYGTQQVPVLATYELVTSFDDYTLDSTVEDYCARTLEVAGDNLFFGFDLPKNSLIIPIRNRDASLFDPFTYATVPKNYLFNRLYYNYGIRNFTFCGISVDKGIRNSIEDILSFSRYNGISNTITVSIVADACIGTNDLSVLESFEGEIQILFESSPNKLAMEMLSAALGK